MQYIYTIAYTYVQYIDTLAYVCISHGYIHTYISTFKTAAKKGHKNVNSLPRVVHTYLSESWYVVECYSVVAFHMDWLLLLFPR